MKRKRKKEADEEITYEFRNLDDVPIPLDADKGLWTKPEVIVIGGKDDNDAIMPCKVDSTGRLDVVGVCPEHQADATISQASPASGTKYEVLPETELVRLIIVVARCTWTVQPTPLEVHVTVDGELITGTQTDPVSNTWYQWYNAATHGGGAMGTAGNIYYRAFVFEGRSVKVEAEITGGTVSNLSARVRWAKW